MIVTFETTADLLKFFSVSSVEALSRLVYKTTQCGGWVAEKDGAIRIGTIVEGSDAEFSETLQFPFTVSDWDDKWKLIEDEADAAWCEANGFPDDV